tara:strand:- start:1887 stop:2063 length:177 start_codon:yes stop_codon:yes gene_type:complete
MSNTKCGSIKVDNKKVWELPEGHHDHRSGSGTHDSRPRRLKTRANIVKQAIKEWEAEQ